MEGSGGATGIGIATQLALTTISGNQFGVYNTNAYAIFAGNTEGIVIGPNLIKGAGQGSAAIILDSLTNATVSEDIEIYGFAGRIQVTGPYSGGLIPGAPTSGSLTISSNTITPYFAVNQVGAGHINTITVPDAKRSQVLTLIPTAAFTYDLTGSSNVAMGGSGTAVVGRALSFTFDPNTGKWHPSY